MHPPSLSSAGGRAQLGISQVVFDSSLRRRRLCLMIEKSSEDPIRMGDEYVAYGSHGISHDDILTHKMGRVLGGYPSQKEKKKKKN